jgi:ppGpp synthetase/RelA/SpoT-type nucleotidyltranferase
MGDPQALTISQVNRLGRRLRHSAGISEADLELLQRLRAEHFDYLTQAQEALRRDISGIRPTSRLKTIQTIIDKLRRERTMALSRMRDIGGIRVVEDIDRQKQDALVDDVRAALGRIGTVAIVDRRARPSHGYRAVHVELEVPNSHFIEIQVRTRLQDQWAQIVERLGDQWGRGIRYGSDPEDAERTIGDTDATRESIWMATRAYADLIDTYETLEVSGRPLRLEELREALEGALNTIQRLAESGRL